MQALNDEDGKEGHLEDVEVFFPEEFDAHEIFVTEGDVVAELTTEELSCLPLPDGAILLNKTQYFPHMNCHALTLALTGLIRDPRGYWVNYGAAESKFEDSKDFISQGGGNLNASIVLFHRNYIDHGKSLLNHSGLFIPNLGVVSLTSGVITLCSIEALRSFYAQESDAYYGEISNDVTMFMTQNGINHEAVELLNLDLNL